MSHARWPTRGGLLALVIGLAALPLRAQEAPPRVSVVLAAEPEQVRALELVLRELLARVDVTIEVTAEAAVDPLTVVTPPPNPAPALARVWIDARDPRTATLYLADSPWERVLVRRVPLDAGLDEVSREQLAHIVESSVEALKAGARIGIEREQVRSDLGLGPTPAAVAPRPEPRAALPAPSPRIDRSPSPVLQRERPFELRLGLGYQAALWTSDRLLHGPLARIDGSLASDGWRFGLALTGQYRAPVRTDPDPIGMRYESVAARTLGTARFAADQSAALLFELGGGLDVERVEPVAEADGGLELTRADSRVRPVLWAGVGIELELFELGWLTAIGGVEIDPSPDDYVFRRGDRTETVATPLVARPAVVLVIGAPLLGG